ncbi:MAG: sulfatase-like hydrolase/transferase [Myxococcota bacterium]|nr:sulfatase-like hydrolase/transferase [Myxococcota bacterium]
MVLADDLGYGDLGSYGHPYASTPHLDRLAEEGVRFTHHYAAAAICIPSRAALMTGRFPARFQKYPADFGLPPLPTVPSLLRRAGYRTAHFGKWHLGPHKAPGTYGLDSLSAHDSDGRGAHKGERGRDSEIFDAAIDFIERNSDAPFYLQVWGHVPHFPVNPHESFMREFESLHVDDADFPEAMRSKLARARSLNADLDKGMQRYLGAVYSLDQDVGRLLRRIDELGLRDRTIVVFTSDNGPAPVSAPNPERGPFEQYRLSMLGSAGPLRGGKVSFFEGGIRVPFIVRWPGHVPAGRVDSVSVTSGIDWLPTVCSITGSDCSSLDIDGEDVSSAWMGRGYERARPLFFKELWTNSHIAVRDGPWKLHLSRPPDRRPRLHRIVDDPSESTDLTDAHPEIAARLSEQAARWNESLPRSYIRASIAPATE